MKSLWMFGCVRGSRAGVVEEIRPYRVLRKCVNAMHGTPVKLCTEAATV